MRIFKQVVYALANWLKLPEVAIELIFILFFDFPWKIVRGNEVLVGSPVFLHGGI